MTINLDKEKIFRIILDERGGPHLTAIILLEELIKQYNALNKNNIANKKFVEEMSIKIDYKYFEEHFMLSYSRVRDAFKILEKKYHLIKKTRIFTRNNTMKGGSNTWITLNIDNLKGMINEKNNY